MAVAQDGTSEGRNSLTLRLIGIVGILVFGLGFALTFLSPIHYERAARDFIESGIESRMQSRVEAAREAMPGARIGEMAGFLEAQRVDEIAALREEIAQAVSRMQDTNCECRRRLLEAVGTTATSRLRLLESSQTSLQRVIEGRYREIVTDLLRDLRFFTGANLLAFVLLLGISFSKPALSRHLLVPGILLACAALAASAAYLFGQNWFFTLLHGSYTGAAYAMWLLLIYGLFCDIVLFKGKVTGTLADALAIPC